MQEQQLTDAELFRELEEYKDAYPHLRDDHLFVMWFLRAFFTENIEDAKGALTGGSNDKGIDAVLVDQKAKTIFIIQGKYRETIGAKHESRVEVINFADTVSELTGELENFREYCDGILPDLEEKLRNARSHILKHRYSLQLYFVTTGLVSNNLVKEADKHAKRGKHPGRCHVIAGRQVLWILSDYLDGVAPPVPTLDLKIGGAKRVQITDAFYRYDREIDIETWLFSMTGESVGNLYRAAGKRIFARNVRGFLGNTRINQSMEATIRDEPELFWYYNNGITMICDQAEHTRVRGENVLRVSNPQIINGLQTTRTLAGANKGAAKVSVVVKVIRVPRGFEGGTGDFIGLVSNIVIATNWQNAIRSSDLISNDRIQVGIQREMRKLRYWYIRKRQTKTEARRGSGSLDYLMIQKVEIAQAVAGCNMDPSIIRGGKEHLFEEPLYEEVFPTLDPYYYLCRYWLMRRVDAGARGHTERGYAKWMVLNFMWHDVSSILQRKSSMEKFVRGSERANDRGRYVIGRLDKCIEKAFIGASRFFKANRGSGPQALDPSGFYKRVGLHQEFRKFWRSPSNASRRPYQGNWKRFLRSFRKFDG